MGVAYIVQGANYAPANLGRVTQVGDVPLEALAIIGPASVIGGNDAASFIASFIPINTTERNISWSIVDGATYASINSSSGMISVLPGASLNNVTIRATSVDNPTITADKQVVVSYTGGGFIPLEDLTARINFSQNGGAFLTDIIPQPGDWFKAKVAMLIDRQAAFFGSRNSGGADLDSVIFERDNTGLTYQSMTGKMYGTKYVSSQVLALDTRYVVELKPSGVQSDPSVGTFATSTYAYTQAPALGIGCLQLANGTKFYNKGGFDFFGLEIYDSNNALKHRLIPQQDLTFKDEVTNVVYSPDTTAGLLYGDD